MTTVAERSTTAIVVPVKAFGSAKARLGPQLSDHERAELARQMATAVVAAAGDLPVFVVAGDDVVARWAAAAGARVVVDPGAGLNAAVDVGVAAAAARGATHVVVAHGDLPRAKRFEHLLGLAPVVMVSDRAGDGTNVIVVPTDAGWQFEYGPGSAARHRAQAERLGLDLVELDDPDLTLDIDGPDDLAVLSA